MKHLIQSIVILAIFSFMIVCAAITANASGPVPAGPTAEQINSELPPDIFDDDCDGGASCPGHQFIDMPPVGHWAHLPIDWALTRHITAGTGNNTFSPKAECTRAQAVTFLWKAAGSPVQSGSDCPFTDVPQDAYFRPAVIWASAKGITSGTSSTTFSPNAVCSRSQIITFLWRAKGSPVSGASTSQFADVPDTAYYHDAVAWALEHRITGGTSADTFSPNMTCTREQIVTFLYKANRS